MKRARFTDEQIFGMLKEQESGQRTADVCRSLYVCAECFAAEDSFGIREYCSEGQLGGLPEYSYLAVANSVKGAPADMQMSRMKRT